MDALFFLFSSFFIVIACSLVAALTWRSTKIRRRKPPSSSQLPAGTLGWPLLGETLEFVSCAYSSRPESFMDKRRLMYGKVFKSHIFGSPTVVSTDAEVSRFVLQSDAGAFVPWYPKSLTELMGKSSILMLNGALQRRVHGLVAAFFKSDHLKAQVTADMHRYVEASMSTWRDGQLLLLQDEAKHIVFQILVRGLIGLEAGTEMQFLKHQFQKFIAGLMSLPVKVPGSRLYRSLQAKKRMVMMIEKRIREKRNSTTRDHHHPRDAVEVLINDGSEELTDELISDNMIDLMIPAEDSVPVLLTLAVKYLSDCPLALQQIQEENMQLKKRKSLLGESLQWTDYMALSFTQDVITETLRLGNIISGIMRKAMRDVEIKGHLIPRGWCFFAYFRSVHLDDDLYHEAYKFNPWRWKKKKKKKKQEKEGEEEEEEEDMMMSSSSSLSGGSSSSSSSLLFTPFGGGRRLCPGLDLARLEASIFLHHLVTGFTWVAEEDQIVNFPTVRMKRRMPIRIMRKEQPEETTVPACETGI